MESAQSNLVNERDRVALLFTPPFDHSEPHPGYIMGYPPGVRENGGQYTHGSLWMAMAWARLGEGDAAVRLLQMMNPVENARDPDAVARYRGEPYVVAADVSSAPGKAGQADGRGTRVRRHGCIASGSRKCSALSCEATG